MRRSMLFVVASVLLAAPGGAGLAGGKKVGPSTPRVVGPRNTTNQSPVYRFSARERGVPAAVIRFRCAVDSTDLQACLSRYEARLTEGTHVLRVQAVDRHGRKSPIARVWITVSKPIPLGAQVVATIQMPEAADPEWIVADPNNVWVHTPDHVVRVSPASNAAAAQVTTPAIQYGYMASSDGAVWQTDFDSDTLLRIDPATNTVAATIPLGQDAAPEGVAVVDGAVWVAEHHQGTVVRIDPATDRVVAVSEITRLLPRASHGFCSDAVSLVVLDEACPVHTIR